VVDQKRLGGGSHSTMGTITDIYAVLRRLYSHIGKPYVGHANVFSFNDPKGMCSNCNGLGRKMGVDVDLFLDKSKTLNEGLLWVNTGRRHPERLVHNAYRIEMRGDSMRKNRGKPNAQGHTIAGSINATRQMVS